MVSLQLYGELGSLFGSERKLNVSSISEAVHALNMMFPKMRRYLHLQEKRGVFFQIVIDNNPISYLAQFGQRLLTNSIVKIIPIPLGSYGSGIGSSNTANSGIAIGIGTLFVVAGALMIASGVAAPIGIALIFGGVALMAMGVIGLLSPQPKFKPEEDKRTSYSFDGVIDAARQGNPVPLVYGRMLINGLTVNSVIRTSSI